MNANMKGGPMNTDWNKNRIEEGDKGEFKADNKDPVAVQFVKDKPKPKLDAESFVNMKSCGVAELHQLIGKDYSQLAVLTAIIAYFSKDTFVCNCTIAKVAEDFDMNRHVVSRAFEALQNKRIMLWGKSEKNEGWVFNPDFFVAGKEYKYKKMWDEAVKADKDRREKFIEAESKKLIQQAQKFVSEGAQEQEAIELALKKYPKYLLPEVEQNVIFGLTKLLTDADFAGGGEDSTSVLEFEV